MGQVSQFLRLDDMLAQDISSAVIRAFQTTFGVEITAGPAEMKRGMVSLVGDVSGVIALVQDGLEGTMTLCLTFETVRDILPRIVGNAISVTHEMTTDAVGELTNMIFGQVKTELNGRGYGLKLGIPSVVTGRGHFVSQFHRGPYMILPFYLEGQLFQVHVALYDNKEEPQQASH
ncbi:MAG: chemotaxis protein CheX [Bdellovibrionales bacterium]|jgi:chemotaxis protein CheX